MRAFTLWVVVLPFVLTLASAAAPAEQQVEAVPGGTPDAPAWSIQTSGKFQGWLDRRHLVVLYHPYEVSASDAHATAEQEVTIPTDWTGPVRLHFYVADDYDGTQDLLEKDYQGKPDWRGQLKLVGHRFKQVLLDGEVVWEADVADAEGVDQPSRFSVVLPERFKPGDRVKLGLRVFDKTGSEVRLPGDSRHLGTMETDEKESDPWRFMTHVYFGDLALTPASESSIPAGEPPSHAMVRTVHAARWPVVPPSADVAFPVSLAVQGNASEGMARAVQCGVPLPRGKVQEVRDIALNTADGGALPLQASPMNRWPDGSLRWVEVNTVLPASLAGAKVLLNAAPGGPPAAAPGAPVQVSQTPDGGARLETGGLELVTGGPGGVLIQHMANGSARLENLTGEFHIGGAAYQACVEQVTVTAAGPVRAEVELAGAIRGQDVRVGRFVFRVAAFAGQPYVRIMYRIFNEQPAVLAVEHFDLVGTCVPGGGAEAYWGREGASVHGDVTVRQLQGDKFEVVDASGARVDGGEAAPGWLGLSGEQYTIGVLVRHFREQFPKAIAYGSGKLRVALFEPSAAEPQYQPAEGEAKRHELWFGLWNHSCTQAQMNQAAGYFAEPLHLFDADYFCASGGFGMAYPHDDTRFAELTAFMRKACPQETKDYVAFKTDGSQATLYQYGIRNWGDTRYGNPPWWTNGYYDRQQGFAAEYLMTGGRMWFRALEATVRHIIDVDVCHASAAHPDWVGGIHGVYGADHTTEGPWNPTQRTKGTLAYWRYTADPDARAAALAAADSAIAFNRAIGATSARDHGGVLYCIMAAYDETRDLKYLEGAARLARDAMGRLDPRRGCYAEVHANVNMRGNVPWLVAQLAEPLYDYYCQSGDVDAAMAVVGMAESILADDCARDDVGGIHGYSFNPHFKMTSAYNVLIAPIFMYAYELSGDPEFLKWARALYQRTVKEDTINSVVNCYWNTPTLLYYLHRNEGAEAP